MNTTQILISAAKDIWDGYSKKPFVQAIQSGNVSREMFRRFILRENMFVEEYAKLFALGAAKSRDNDTLRLFTRCTLNVVKVEADMLRGYIYEFDLTYGDVLTIEPGLTDISYASYMLRTAYEGDAAQILSCALVRSYSYQLIALKIIRNNPEALSHRLTGDWLRCYASPGYDDTNSALLMALNRLTADFTKAQLDSITDIFINCSRFAERYWEEAGN